MFYNVCNNCAKTSCSGCTYEVFRLTCYFPTWYFYPGYDSDRYELVEKKDWKINNLKKELKEIEDNIEQKKLEIESCNIFIEQYEKDLEAINSKLKELETNKE